jgi:signal transduction histidine kinase
VLESAQDKLVVATGGSRPSRIRFPVKVMILTCFIVLSWQSITWPLIHWAERVARPVSLEHHKQVEYQYLDANRRPISDLKPVRQLGLEGYVVESRDGAEGVVFKVHFSVADPAQPLALYLSIREQTREMRVNGTSMQAANTLARLEGLLTSEPSYYPIAASSLRVGENLLEVEKDLIGFKTALAQFAIGPADQLAESYRWKTLFNTDLSLVSVAILFFATLLCGVVNWPSEDRPRIRAVMLLMTSCALSIYLLSLSPPFELSLPAFIFAWVTLNLATAIASIQYALLDLGVSNQGVAKLRWAWTLILIPALVCFVFLPEHPERALTLVMFAGYQACSAASLFAIIALAVALAKGGKRRLFERTILAMCWTALIVDRIGSIYDLHSPFDANLPITLPWTPIMGWLFGLAMVFSLAREAAQARFTVIRANEDLQSKLSAREAELEQSYFERNQMQRQAAIAEERQRIVRDMHDGIGGQLLGLLMRVKHRSIDSDKIEMAVSDSLNDLRLMVDALDVTDLHLSDALINFERRARAQLAESSISLRVDDALDQPISPLHAASAIALGPTATLHVLRILQEGLSNAQRHSGASLICLRCHREADESLVLALADNGKGLADPLATGRGIVNMRNRAQLIGASLQIGRSQEFGGTEIVLRIPQ